MKHAPGFTLVEVMVAGFMMVTIVTIGEAFWRFTRQNYEFSVTQYRLTENATRAVRTMSQEIREARDAMDGAYPLESLEDNQLIFYADIDNDTNVERIRYTVSGQNLVQGIVVPTGNPPQYVLSGEKTTLLAEQITATHSAVFNYYNGDWPGDTTNNPLPPTTRLLETRMVEIILPLTIRDANGYSSYTAQTTVHIRNLKDNL